MRNHQIECTETLFQLFRGEGILGPNQLNINHLGAGTIKILLFQGPIFQHFIVVFAAESPYLWYRQKDPKNARMDCIAGVYDKLYRRRGLASPEPNHSERDSQIPLY